MVLFQRAAPKADILALLRTDHERVRESASIPPGVLGMDWLEEGAGERSLMRARRKIDSLLPSTQQPNRLRRHQMLPQWRLRRGITLLSPGSSAEHLLGQECSRT